MFERCVTSQEKDYGQSSQRSAANGHRVNLGLNPANIPNCSDFGSALVRTEKTVGIIDGEIPAATERN
ncbi:hypothetical protein Tco_1549244 [Tanacetum coccineum]